MGTKTHNNYEDLITFTRASGGHALRPVSYGSELVTNGTFDSDISGIWTDLLSTSTWEGSYLESVSTASGRGPYQVFTTVAGKMYRATGDVLSTTGEVMIRVGDGTTPDAGIADSDSATSAKNLSVVFIAESTTSYVYLRHANAGTAQWDNISIKEVTFDESDGTLTLFEHPDNIPRVEYDADGNRLGLLVEESRTNLVTYSEDFSNANWVKVRASVAENTDGIKAPDGSAAIKLTGSTDNSSHFIYVALTATGDRTLSVFAKKAELSWLTLANTSFGSLEVSFDLQNGAVGSSTGFSSSNIENVGGGWYRCSAVVPSATADGSFDFVIALSSGDGVINFAGSSSEGVYIYGAQYETGSFPTSYIKTTGSTATRSADVASIPTADFGYNHKAGTILVEGEYKFNATGSGFPRIFEIGNTTTSENRITIYIFEAGNDAIYGSHAANVQQAAIPLIIDQTDGVFEASKLAVVFAEDNFIGVADGVVKGTDTSGTIVPSIPRNVLAIGKQASGSTAFVTGHFKSIKYYPRALTSAQLQDITS